MSTAEHAETAAAVGVQTRTAKRVRRPKLGDTWWRHVVGIIGVVAIIVAVVSGSVPAGSKEAPLAALEKLPMVHYVHSGRLIADARTAIAMVHYFFESDKPSGTNTSEPGPMLKRLAMPTNNAAGGPKA